MERKKGIRAVNSRSVCLKTFQMVERTKKCVSWGRRQWAEGVMQAAEATALRMQHSRDSWGLPRAVSQWLNKPEQAGLETQSIYGCLVRGQGL